MTRPALNAARYPSLVDDLAAITHLETTLSKAQDALHTDRGVAVRRFLAGLRLRG